MQHNLYLLEISTWKEINKQIVLEPIAIKIGITNNITRRLQEIQNGTPFHVKPIRILKGNKETCRYCETQIKKRCRGYKLSERNFSQGFQETMDVRYTDWLNNLYDSLVEGGMDEVVVE